MQQTTKKMMPVTTLLTVKVPTILLQRRVATAATVVLMAVATAAIEVTIHPQMTTKEGGAPHRVAAVLLPVIITTIVITRIMLVVQGRQAMLGTNKAITITMPRTKYLLAQKNEEMPTTAVLLMEAVLLATLALVATVKAALVVLLDLENKLDPFDVANVKATQLVTTRTTPEVEVKVTTKIWKANILAAGGGIAIMPGIVR